MENQIKKLGVIGGLGPKATAYFYNMIVDNTVAKKDQEHIEAVYLNHASMPDRTESILSNDTKELRELLIKDAQLLETLGCSHIAIPCNTSHYFIDEIQVSVNIPVINMIDETIQYIKRKYGNNVEKIGVLATNGAREVKVYDKFAEKQGVQIMYPNLESQRKVMEVIYDGVKAGKEVSPSELDNVILELVSQGCRAVILGCTELSVMFENHSNEYVVDALYPLALKSIHLSGKESKE